MVSANLIDRMFRRHQPEALIDALSANGYDFPPVLRIRLAQPVHGDPAATPPAALAMGLRRLVELTYGPTSLSRAMTHELLAQQQPDGSFADDPIATAAAVAALDLLLTDHHGLQPDESAAAIAAIERAIASLIPLQDADGLFTAPCDRTLQDRALTSAFLALMLAGHDAARTGLRFADLLDWFEQHQDDLEPYTRRLWLTARTAAPLHPTPNPTLAAIAA